MLSVRSATASLLLSALLAVHAGKAQPGAPASAASIAQAERSCALAILAPGECDVLLAQLRSHGTPFRARIDPEEQRRMLQLKEATDSDFHPTPEQQALLATPPERPWSDAGKRFSLMVPAGWRIDDAGGTLRLIQGDTWVQIRFVAVAERASASGGSLQGSADPMDLAWTTARAVAPLVSDWKLAGGYEPHADPAHAAGVLAVSCTVPLHRRASNRMMIFLVEQADAGHVLQVTESSDAHAAQAASEALWQMVRSVHFAAN